MRTFDDVLDDLGRDGFGHYLAGFVDGEGTFIITRTHDARSAARRGPTYACHLKVRLRDDDAAILNEFQKRTGLGRLYAECARGNANPQMTWKVHSQADVAQTVRLFERFPLRAKKAADFAIWRLAVQEWLTKRRYGSWERMAALRQQLNSGRRYGEPDEEAPEQPEAVVLHLQLPLGEVG